ncbi:MAG: hypothetical protein M3Z09_08055 [Acidobacteriota bacterium]|nr:hypothetical protein [Acidobacteriota bacterium]
MATDSQITANRANAQKSTGPRSLEGKRRSSFNALKHGACATQIVLPYEKRADYDRFHQNLLDDFQPQSALEELMLERLATAQWLSRRVVGCMQDAFDVADRGGLSTVVSYPVLMKMKNQNDRTADRCTEMLLKLQRDRAKEHREFLKTQELPKNGFVPPKKEESAPPPAQPGLHVVQNDAGPPK